MANEREDSIDKLSIGALISSGVIKLIDIDNPLIVDGIKFSTSYVAYTSFEEHIQTIKLDPLFYNILLLHHFYDDAYPGLTKEQVDNIGDVKAVFLGHEHTPFPKLVKYTDKGVPIYRCGSFVRKSSDESSLKRIPKYFLIDSETKEVQAYELDCAKPAEEVFCFDAVNKSTLRKRKFIENINSVIERYQQANAEPTERLSVAKILKDELKCPDGIFEYIESVYERNSLTLR